MPLLEVENVTKRYGAFTAVDGVSFTAQPGRILGLLGPNGAGKTSTIRMITRITTPDEGAIRIGGEPLGPQHQRRMGYLPEERGLYRKLKVGEQLVYFGELRGLSRADARARTTRWLERLGLMDWAGKKTEELSKGMQQKVQFASALLHEPDLLILDEPFSGLDPVNAELLKTTVLEERAKGKTILFASHRMEQVEQMCDDLCLIARGRVVLAGPVREVKQRFARDVVHLEFDGDDGFLDRLAAEQAVRVVERGPGTAEVQLLDGTPPRRVLDAALGSVHELYRFSLDTPSLQDIFVRTVGETARVAGGS
ncbi:MAG: ATP-binding cassette domain-containing protein [Bacteroidetes bacterium]|nr:ATP-binding cassette domain-containing protein [Bacteroidota bacterium]